MESREKFIITDEMIRGAESYIPFVDKLTIVAETAEACLEPVDRETAGIATETQLPIPQLYKERSGTKQYFLMYYLLTRYLHVEVAETGWTMEEYDYYASAFPVSQIERFKSWNADWDSLKGIPFESPEYTLKKKQLKEQENEIKCKVFDILYDYKQLKSMLEVEIYNLKEAKNSALDRLQDSIALFASPENVAKLNELMKKDLGELEEAQKKLAAKRGKAKAEAKPAEEKPTEA